LLRYCATFGCRYLHAKFAATPLRDCHNCHRGLNDKAALRTSMQLLYDVSTEPITWGSAYLLWLCALTGIFFFCAIGFGDPRPQASLRGHRTTYFAAAGLLALVATVGLALGLHNRTECVALVGYGQVVEGQIQDLSRGRSNLTHVRFKVGSHQFDSEPGPINGCGYVRSIAEVVSLKNGDFIRILFHESRILKVWRRTP
jgi:hypothetical protein